MEAPQLRREAIPGVGAVAFLSYGVVVGSTSSEVTIGG